MQIAHKRLTYKEATLVKERAKGKKVLEAATTANYLPNATPETRRVEAQRTLQKPHVKAALEIALEKHNITLDRALAPISKGLSATKVNYVTGEIEDDIKTQLASSDRALRLHGVGSGEQQGSLHLHLHAQQTKYNL